MASGSVHFEEIVGNWNAEFDDVNVEFDDVIRSERSPGKFYDNTSPDENPEAFLDVLATGNFVEPHQRPKSPDVDGDFADALSEAENLQIDDSISECFGSTTKTTPHRKISRSKDQPHERTRKCSGDDSKGGATLTSPPVDFHKAAKTIIRQCERIEKEYDSNGTKKRVKHKEETTRSRYPSVQHEAGLDSAPPTDQTRTNGTAFGSGEIELCDGVNNSMKSNHKRKIAKIFRKKNGRKGSRAQRMKTATPSGGNRNKGKQGFESQDIGKDNNNRAKRKVGILDNRVTETDDSNLRHAENIRHNDITRLGLAGSAHVIEVNVPTETRDQTGEALKTHEPRDVNNNRRSGKKDLSKQLGVPDWILQEVCASLNNRNKTKTIPPPTRGDTSSTPASASCNRKVSTSTEETEIKRLKIENSHLGSILSEGRTIATDMKKAWLRIDSQLNNVLSVVPAEERWEAKSDETVEDIQTLMNGHLASLLRLSVVLEEAETDQGVVAKKSVKQGELPSVSTWTQTMECSLSLNRTVLKERRRHIGRNGSDNKYAVAETFQHDLGEQEDMYETLKLEESKPQLVGKVSPFRREGQGSRVAAQRGVEEIVQERDHNGLGWSQTVSQTMHDPHQSPSQVLSVRIGHGVISQGIVRDLDKKQTECAPKLPNRRNSSKVSEKDPVYDQPRPLQNSKGGYSKVQSGGGYTDAEPPPLPVARRAKNKVQGARNAAEMAAQNLVSAKRPPRAASEERRKQMATNSHRRYSSTDGTSSSVAPETSICFRRHSWDRPASTKIPADQPTSRKESQTVGTNVLSQSSRGVDDASPEHQYLSLLPDSPVTIKPAAATNSANVSGSPSTRIKVADQPDLPHAERNDLNALGKKVHPKPHGEDDSCRRIPDAKIEFEPYGDKLLFVPQLTSADKQKGSKFCGGASGEAYFSDTDVTSFDGCSTCPTDMTGFEAINGCPETGSIAPEENSKQRFTGIFVLMERVNSKWKEIEQKYGSDEPSNSKHANFETTNHAVENCRALSGSGSHLGPLSAFIKVGARAELGGMGKHSRTDVNSVNSSSVANVCATRVRTEIADRSSRRDDIHADCHVNTSRRTVTNTRCEDSPKCKSDKPRQTKVSPTEQASSSAVSEPVARRRRSRSRRRRSSDFQSSQDSEFADKSDSSDDEGTPSPSVKRLFRGKLARRKVANASKQDSVPKDAAHVGRRRIISAGNDVETSDVSSMDGATTRPPRRRFSDDPCVRKKPPEPTIWNIPDTTARRPDIPRLRQGVGMVRSKGNISLNRISGNEGEAGSCKTRTGHAFQKSQHGGKNKDGERSCDELEKVRRVSSPAKPEADILRGVPARNSSVMRASYSQIKEIYEGKTRKGAAIIKYPEAEKDVTVKEKAGVLQKIQQPSRHEVHVSTGKEKRLVLNKVYDSSDMSSGDENKPWYEHSDEEVLILDGAPRIVKTDNSIYGGTNDANDSSIYGIPNDMLVTFF